MLKPIIEAADIQKMAAYLEENPRIVRQFISFGPSNRHKVLPIHYVCDCVFEQKIDEPSALQMVRLLVQAGADINGPAEPGKDSSLIAASSLHCDDIALYLIRLKADVSHRGTHGGTCLHWAAWTGADKVVRELLSRPVNLEDAENEFVCTPLLWAINGWLRAREKSARNQEEAIRLLIQAGADRNAKDKEGNSAASIFKKERREDLLLP